MAAVASGVAFAAPAAGQTFTDVTASAGASYSRAFSANYAILQTFIDAQLVTLDDFPSFPAKPRGAPGVALLDYDGDGDLDVYVTNGPGAANSLLSNQLVETGSVAFLDVAVAAGADATAQDSTGVCFGDTDNDGDEDLLVLGQNEPNVFLENQGDGTFADVTGASSIGGAGLGGASCSMGDVNGDGLLDIAVANTFDWSSLHAMFDVPFALNHPNDLFLNAGNNQFTNVATAAGIRNVTTISWAVAMVDYDLDGDVDIVFADDQGAIDTAAEGGLDRGLLRVYQNDGTASFTDVTALVGTDKPGGWMGLAYADLNCDGNMDQFGSNFGDYLFEVTGVPNMAGDNETRWFLGQANGTFFDTGPTNGFGTLPFGWGTSTFDYDNDGDFDLIWHGGIEFSIWQDVTNPGAILRNNGCGAGFVRDALALAGSTNHSRRAVHGMAVGDLNGDGFPDVVSVSNKVSPEPIPLIPLSPLGGPFDDAAFFTPNFVPIQPDPNEPPVGFLWSGNPYQPGDLSIELNSGVPGNGYVVVKTVGGAGAGGTVNRDGIGAVVTVTPAGGSPSMKPVLGGSSYASEDALAMNFGLGSAATATVEVLWPGGTTTVVQDVPAGSTVEVREVPIPEIGCDIHTAKNCGQYIKCVVHSLKELLEQGVITKEEKKELLAAAIEETKSGACKKDDDDEADDDDDEADDDDDEADDDHHGGHDDDEADDDHHGGHDDDHHHGGCDHHERRRGHGGHHGFTRGNGHHKLGLKL